MVGGNIIVTVASMPSLDRISHPVERISSWSLLYDRSRLVMVSLALIASISYLVAAYYAPTSTLSYSMSGTSFLAISVIPFTRVAIMPTINKLKNIEASKDSTKAAAEGDKLLAKWGTLSLARWLIMLLALLNGLKDISKR